MHLLPAAKTAKVQNYGKLHEFEFRRSDGAIPALSIDSSPLTAYEQGQRPPFSASASEEGGSKLLPEGSRASAVNPLACSACHPPRDQPCPSPTSPRTTRAVFDRFSEESPLQELVARSQSGSWHYAGHLPLLVSLHSPLRHPELARNCICRWAGLRLCVNSADKGHFFLATFVSATSIILQLKNYRKPALQRCVVRIMVMSAHHALPRVAAQLTMEQGTFVCDFIPNRLVLTRSCIRHRCCPRPVRGEPLVTRPEV